MTDMEKIQTNSDLDEPHVWMKWFQIKPIFKQQVTKHFKQFFYMKIGLASKIFRSNSHKTCREIICKRHGLSGTRSVEISKNEQFRTFYVHENMNISLYSKRF